MFMTSLEIKHPEKIAFIVKSLNYPAISCQILDNTCIFLPVISIGLGMTALTSSFLYQLIINFIIARTTMKKCGTHVTIPSLAMVYKWRLCDCVLHHLFGIALLLILKDVHTVSSNYQSVIDQIIFTAHILKDKMIFLVEESASSHHNDLVSVKKKIIPGWVSFSTLPLIIHSNRLDKFFFSVFMCWNLLTLKYLKSPFTILWRKEEKKNLP